MVCAHGLLERPALLKKVFLQKNGAEPQTLFQIKHGSKKSVRHISVFSCKVFVAIPS